MILRVKFSFSSLEESCKDSKGEDVYFMLAIIEDWFNKHKIDKRFRLIKNLNNTDNMQYVANFDKFYLGSFVELLREFTWKYPDSIRLLCKEFSSREPLQNDYTVVEVLPTFITLGYFGKGVLPTYYISNLKRYLGVAVHDNDYHSHKERPKTRFIMSHKVWESLVEAKVFSKYNGKVMFSITWSGECEVILKDDVILKGGNLKEDLLVSPIYYYKNYEHWSYYYCYK